MKYYEFAAIGYAAVMLVLILWSASDFVFDRLESGEWHTSKFIVRVLLAIVWPFASLSAGGRNKLFKGFGS